MLLKEVADIMSGHGDKVTKGQHMNPILLGPCDACFTAIFSFPTQRCWLDDHQGRFRLLSDGGQVKALKCFNPRPGGGGGWCHPPEVFLRCTPNYEADRAEILHSLWDILCATFGKKNLTGSCQVTELWRHKRYYCFQNKLVTQLHPTYAVNTQLKARINVNIG